MKYSEADRIASIGNDDLVALGHEDSQGATGYVSGVVTIEEVGEKVNNSVEYSTDLETTNKTIIGAINEIAQGGGSVDITSEIDIPAPIMTFNDGGDNIPMKSLVAEIKAVQAGTGTPSPQNVRSISGFANVNVVRCGKNLCPYIEQGSINQTSGQDQPSNDVKRSGYIRIKPTFIICISGFTNNVSIRAFWYGKNKEYLGNEVFSQSATNIVITNTDISYSDVYFIRFQAVNSLISNSMQVEWGSTATTYEAYQGTTDTIPLGSTVYGGSLECVEGEGEITYGYVELDGSSDESFNWSVYGQTVYITHVQPDMKLGLTQNGLCNWLEVHSTTLSLGVRLGGTTDSNTIIFDRIPDNISDVTDLASWRTYLSNHPIQIVYPLATPTSLSVSGANIPTLSGLNNIYADSGDIKKIEYFNNNANDVARMVELISGKQVDLIGTLATGQTSLTIQNDVIKTTSMIDVYTDDFGVNPSNIVVTNGQIVLTFSAQASDVNVKVRVS